MYLLYIHIVFILYSANDALTEDHENIWMFQVWCEYILGMRKRLLELESDTALKFINLCCFW